MNPQRDTPSRAWMILGLIVAVGAALRLARLDCVPPGMWFDEALNAQDAEVVADGGSLRLVYPNEFPREPMFVTLLAGVTRLWGPNLTALRALSAVLGLLTIVVVYLAVRIFSGQRVALLAAGVLASMRWHVIFSRLLFRTLLMPLWIALIVWTAGRAKKNPSWMGALTLGALVGGGFYTYLSWYFMAPGVAALVVWVFWDARNQRSIRRQAAGCLIAALLVASPIGVEYMREPELLLSRPEAVSPLGGEGGAALRAVAKNAIEALGMFHYRGDHVPTQNIPRAPALDPIQGVFFLIGAWVCCLGAARRLTGETIWLVWLVLGILPTVFSKTDSPNFLRTLAAAPAAAVLVAEGMVAVWNGLERRFGKKNGFAAGVAIMALALAASGAWTARDLFVRWARSPEVWARFNGGEAQLGRSATRAPEDVAFWMPELIADHRTFAYLSHGGPWVKPYRNFDFLRRDPGMTGRRLVVATAHNGVFPVLKALCPGGRVVQEFRTPDGRVWALLYEIPPGALPPDAQVDRAEADHRVDLRF